MARLNQKQGARNRALTGIYGANRLAGANGSFVMPVEEPGKGDAERFPDNDWLVRLPWNEVLRGLREAANCTQGTWAKDVGVNNDDTVRRWEQAESAPRADAAEGIVRACRERGLLEKRHRVGRLEGIYLTEDSLRALLVAARQRSRTVEPNTNDEIRERPPVRFAGASFAATGATAQDTLPQDATPPAAEGTTKSLANAPTQTRFRLDLTGRLIVASFGIGLLAAAFAVVPHRQWPSPLGWVFIGCAVLVGLGISVAAYKFLPYQLHGYKTLSIVATVGLLQAIVLGVTFPTTADTLTYVVLDGTVGAGGNPGSNALTQARNFIRNTPDKYVGMRIYRGLIRQIGTDCTDYPVVLPIEKRDAFVQNYSDVVANTTASGHASLLSAVYDVIHTDLKGYKGTVHLYVVFGGPDPVCDPRQTDLIQKFASDSNLHITPAFFTVGATPPGETQTLLSTYAQVTA